MEKIKNDDDKNLEQKRQQQWGGNIVKKLIKVEQQSDNYKTDDS